MTTFQAYLVKRLDLPHYQVSKALFERYIRALLREKKRPLIYRTTVIDATSPGSFLRLLNKLPRRACEMLKDKSRAVEIVAACPEAADGRGNLFVDIGHASGKNVGPAKDAMELTRDWGVSKPRRLKEKQGMEHFLSDMVLMTDLMPILFPEEPEMFNNPERNERFAGALVEGNKVETARFSLSSDGILVDVHEDTENDKCDERYSHVMNVSFPTVHPITGEAVRESKIAYGRQSAFDFLKRFDVVSPVVEDVYSYHRELDDTRKVLSPDLLSFDGYPACEGIKRIPPHMNKCVFFSSFSYIILRLFELFNLNVWQVAGLLMNVCASETPDYYYDVGNCLLMGDPFSLNAELPPINELTGQQIGFYLQQEIFKRKNLAMSTPGQRHQPHSGSGPCTWEQAGHGVELLVRLHFGFEMLEPNELGIRYYYSKAVGMLCVTEKNPKTTSDWTCYGVKHAGPLTAQHVIGVGSLVDYFPNHLLEQAEVGTSTATARLLIEEPFNFPKDKLEDSFYYVLLAIKNLLLVSFFVAENLLCKTFSDSLRFVDSIFRGQNIYFYCAAAKSIMCYVTSASSTEPQKCEKPNYVTEGLDPFRAEDIRQIEPYADIVKRFWDIKIDKKLPNKKKRKSTKEMIKKEPLEPFLIPPSPSQLCVAMQRSALQLSILAPRILELRATSKSSQHLAAKWIRYTVGGTKIKGNNTYNASVMMKKRGSFFTADPSFVLYRSSNPGVVNDGLRWFPTKKAALEHVMFALLMTHNVTWLEHCFVPTYGIHWLPTQKAKRILKKGEDRAIGETKEFRRRINYNVNDEVEEDAMESRRSGKRKFGTTTKLEAYRLHVFFDTAKNSQGKSKLPWAYMAWYENGKIEFGLVDDCGNPQSDRHQLDVEVSA
jgi:hypothetical protein